MAGIVKQLTERGLIKPPSFLTDNTQYEVIMGSTAYGVSNDTSDIDLYGFCIPAKEIVFPHLAGEILGFGKEKKRFEQYQQHHIKDNSAGKEYDITIYSIVRYFHLVMENNPNMVDSLFVPQRCVLTCTPLAQMVREKRDMFLTKKIFHTTIGYAYAQKNKLNREPIGKRVAIVEQYGFDVKYAMHLYRLCSQCEQIMTEGTLELDYKPRREKMKAIRRGEVPLADILQEFDEKEKYLRKLYETSTLPHGPDEAAIKELLLNCLEQHYGSLDKVIHQPHKYENALRKVKDIADEVLLH